METQQGRGDQVFEAARPVAGQIRYHVKILAGGMLEKMAKWEHMEMQRSTRFAQNVVLPTAETLRRYFANLIWIRVTQATNPRELKSYKPLLYSANVPNRLSTVLENVGVAVDNGHNIKFVPVFEIDADDLLSPSELVEISDMIDFLEGEYHFVKGIARGEEGSIELMSKMVISEPEAIAKVLSYRKDNPVYAFFAAILEFQVVGLTYEDLFRQYRVQYSHTETYESRFNEFYRASANVPSPLTGG